MLVYIDNCKRVLGFKRNALMREAQGKFVAHIDDDEMLAEDYFTALLPALNEDVDLVAYDASVSLNGSPEFKVTTGIGLENQQPRTLPGGRYSDITRTPWHWCAWRRELALQCSFPLVHDGAEDAFFLRQALPLVRSWRKVDRVLFFHRYDHSDSTFS